MQFSEMKRKKFLEGSPSFYFGFQISTSIICTLLESFSGIYFTVIFIGRSSILFYATSMVFFITFNHRSSSILYVVQNPPFWPRLITPLTPYDLYNLFNLRIMIATIISMTNLNSSIDTI